MAAMPAAPTLRSMFFGTMKSCARLVSGRGSPADVTHSTTLFGLTALLAMTMGFAARLAMPRPGPTTGLLAVNSVGEIGVLVAFFYFVLRVRDKGSRFVQLATTLCMISLVADVLLVGSRLALEVVWIARVTIVIMLVQAHAAIVAIHKTLEIHVLHAIGIFAACLMTISMFYAYVQLLFVSPK